MKESWMLVVAGGACLGAAAGVTGCRCWARSHAPRSYSLRGRRSEAERRDAEERDAEFRAALELARQARTLVREVRAAVLDGLDGLEAAAGQLSEPGDRAELLIQLEAFRLRLGEEKTAVADRKVSPAS